MTIRINMTVGMSVDVAAGTGELAGGRVHMKMNKINTQCVVPVQRTDLSSQQNSRKASAGSVPHGV